MSSVEEVPDVTPRKVAAAVALAPFLDRLGIVKIPANEVTLDPYVLGKKFKRHADRIILRQNGVK